MKPETICVHASNDAYNSTGAIAVPIYQSATFSHDHVGHSTGFDYSRLQNPTRQAAENVVNALEGAFDTLAFSSGMAAIDALTQLFSCGDEIIASDDLYGGSIRLFDNLLKERGIIIHYVNTSELPLVAALLNKNTRAVFVESPTNPMMRVTDIASIKRLIADRDILLIMDNTFLTPYYCTPIKFGVDVVVHSATKYLSGHNDTLAGFLSVANSDLSQKLRYIQKTTGAVLSPFDSFMVIRGIKTLAIRMDKAQSNCLQIAEWLSSQEKVTSVLYTGLPSHPQYELSKSQASGFGAMISFTVDSENTAVGILNKTKLIAFAESLGGVETLITYPYTQTHADVPETDRRSRGIDETLLRLSVGIEAVHDLISDLEQAFK